MRVQHVERMALIGVLVLLIGLSIWMHFGLMSRDTDPPANFASHEPDYFIRNFIATGRNETSAQYVLTGVYLEHFPDDHSVKIERPCLLLFEKGIPYRHVYGDTGRIVADGKEVIFSGNVQVLERPAAQAYDWNPVIVTSAPSDCFPEDMANSGTLTRTDALVVQLKPLSKG